jgi:hypothetical protein
MVQDQNIVPSGILDYGQFIWHLISQKKPWHFPDKASAIEFWQKSPEKLIHQYKLYWYYRGLTPWRV